MDVLYSTIELWYGIVWEAVGVGAKKSGVANAGETRSATFRRACYRFDSCSSFLFEGSMNVAMIG